ncbi:hypothetical protein HGA91_00845 [candidate division WWE3 bacterium]|nr:hypothetical protein [candidate division WWE3 bacterium]
MGLVTQSHKVLHYLFTSRVRLKLLEIFIPYPDQMYYVRQITRMVNEEVNAVRRELERLRSIGLLTTEQRSNRLYYKVRREFIFYSELLRMIGKTTGFGRELLENIDQYGKIKYTTISLRFIKHVHPGPNDIDILIVGKVQLDVLQSLVRTYEDKLGHEINYTVMTEDEFSFRKNRGDAFIRTVLALPHVVLIGDEDEIAS